MVYGSLNETNTRPHINRSIHKWNMFVYVFQSVFNRAYWLTYNSINIKSKLNKTIDKNVHFDQTNGGWLKVPLYLVALSFISNSKSIHILFRFSFLFFVQKKIHKSTLDLQAKAQRHTRRKIEWSCLINYSNSLNQKCIKIDHSKLSHLCEFLFHVTDANIWKIDSCVVASQQTIKIDRYILHISWA